MEQESKEYIARLEAERDLFDGGYETGRAAALAEVIEWCEENEDEKKKK